MNSMNLSQMRAPRPVLAAVDFGQASRAAALLAARVADAAGAPLYLLHVIHDPADEPGFYRRRQPSTGPLLPVEEIAATLCDECLSELRREHPELASLREAQFKLVAGLPRQRIREVGQSLGAGVLIVGSHRGKGPLARLLPAAGQRYGAGRKLPVVEVFPPWARLNNGSDEQSLEAPSTWREVHRLYGAAAA